MKDIEKKKEAHKKQMKANVFQKVYELMDRYDISIEDLMKERKNFVSDDTKVSYHRRIRGNKLKTQERKMALAKVKEDTLATKRALTDKVRETKQQPLVVNDYSIVNRGTNGEQETES